jgi:hypothetical protein
MLVYITCPAVSAAHGRPLGFNIVTAEQGAVMLASLQAYGLNHPGFFPGLGYCDPLMPQPGPGAGPPPPPPPPPPACPAPTPSPVFAP